MIITAIEELTNEERDLIGSLDLANPDDRKKFIKSVIRYEVDSYVVTDCKTQDPIVISDEEIDSSMDFFVEAFNENMKIPYLDMNKNVLMATKTRKLLKNSELLLYARKQFAQVDLGIADGDTDLSNINTDMGDIVDYSKILEDSKENTNNIKKTDGVKLLIQYLIKMRYGGKNMSQIDLIMEKLTYDIEKLRESTVVGKDKTIKELTRAEHMLSIIGDDSNEWHDYFMGSIVTDKRALNLAKEIDKNYIKAKRLIDNIFGPKMIDEFIAKYEMTNDISNDSVFYFYAMLLFYTLAKKIESKMKSGDNRSLIYRGYIIHYMMDSLTEGELKRMTLMFSDIFNAYTENKALFNKLSSMQKISK